MDAAESGATIQMHRNFPPEADPPSVEKFRYEFAAANICRSRTPVRRKAKIAALGCGSYKALP